MTAKRAPTTPRHIPGPVKLNAVTVKRFGSSASGLRYVARLHFSEPPFTADSAVTWDEREAQHIKQFILRHSRRFEAAWGNTTLLETLFKEAEDAAAQAQFPEEGE